MTRFPFRSPAMMSAFGGGLTFILLAMSSPHAYGGWTELDVSSPQNGGPACTYDGVRDRGVRFGGDDSTLQQVTDTYEWNGTSWQLITSNGPSRRVNAAMAFDTTHGKSILFGGWALPDNYLGDTWAWDGNQWSQLSPTSSPPARGNHTMVYDKSRGKIVLFGGSLYQTIYGDTWEWDGASWAWKSSTGPGPRLFPRMAYDESRGKVVLFGGQTTYFGTFYGDTWEWDGTSWTQVATTGPSPRAWHMMVYDPVRQHVVLFGGGGWGRSASFNDMWEWDGHTWTQIMDYGPASRIGACMFFDDSQDALVLFGGFNNGETYATLDDTWKYAPGNKIACQGFEPPMDVYPVTVKGKNRALPLKAQLFDADGALVTNMSITAAPVVQVRYDSGSGGDAVDVTDDALPAGQGTDGNQFVFTDDLKWQFNLQTTNYTAPGTYTISIVSGDNAEYSIEPACVTSFERK